MTLQTLVTLIDWLLEANLKNKKIFQCYLRYTGISRLTQHRFKLFYYNVCYAHYLTTRLDDCQSYALIINQQSLIQKRIYSCEL
ncbi:hypothetical protein T07_10368 [Trichinella nelsoni]|uniref:Uncharacterized protein n=1 Tax=Trichinella nelsoni TaxID=6336 RepID=A0A0V0SJ05_9BILA|nr:hypothetical protein T07_10368 [Trichinella nelsoni]